MDLLVNLDSLGTSTTGRSVLAAWKNLSFSASPPRGVVIGWSSFFGSTPARPVNVVPFVDEQVPIEIQPVVVRSAPAHRHQDDRVGLADPEVHSLLEIRLLASHQLRVRNDFRDEHLAENLSRVRLS